MTTYFQPKLFAVAYQKQLASDYFLKRLFFMAKALSWTQVKKHIQDFPASSLMDLVQALYQASDYNKAFLTARFEPWAVVHSKEVAALKKRIHRMLCPVGQYTEPSLSEARRLIRDYKKTKDLLGWMDLLLSYVEAGLDYGHENPTNSRYEATMRDELKKFLAQYDVEGVSAERLFRERLIEVLKRADYFYWSCGAEMLDPWYARFEIESLIPKRRYLTINFGGEQHVVMLR